MIQRRTRAAGGAGRVAAGRQPQRESRWKPPRPKGYPASDAGARIFRQMARESPPVSDEGLMVAQNAHHQLTGELARQVADDRKFFAGLIKELDIKLSDGASRLAGIADKIHWPPRLRRKVQTSVASVRSRSLPSTIGAVGDVAGDVDHAEAHGDRGVVETRFAPGLRQVALLELHRLDLVLDAAAGVAGKLFREIAEHLRRRQAAQLGEVAAAVSGLDVSQQALEGRVVVRGDGDAADAPASSERPPNAPSGASSCAVEGMPHRHRPDGPARRWPARRCQPRNKRTAR